MRQHFKILYEMIRSFFIPPKEKLLEFEEIGFTITIPKGLRILTEEQIKKTAKKNAHNIEALFANEVANNSECKQLFFAKNAENSFMSGIRIQLNDRTQKEAQQDYDEYIASYWNSLDKTHKTYSRVYAERKSTNIMIGNIAFEKDEISWRIPERKISCFYSYHSLHKGFQIAITAAFINQEFGAGILKSIENASFV